MKIPDKQCTYMVLRLPSDELPELDPLGLDGWELVTTTNTKPTKARLDIQAIVSYDNRRRS